MNDSGWFRSNKLERLISECSLFESVRLCLSHGKPASFAHNNYASLFIFKELKLFENRISPLGSLRTGAEVMKYVVTWTCAWAEVMKHESLESRYVCTRTDKIESCTSQWINNIFVTNTEKPSLFNGISVNYRSRRIFQLELTPHWQPLYRIRTWNSHLFWKTAIKRLKWGKNQLIISLWY